jgi:acyl-CoA synthetase (AMP-forming)/AMP-acid ligase II
MHAIKADRLYNWMLQLAKPGAYDLSSLRIMTYAGSPFPPELLKKCIERFGPIFMQAYGMTEFIGGTSLSMEDHCLEGERSRLSPVPAGRLSEWTWR